MRQLRRDVSRRAQGLLQMRHPRSDERRNAAESRYAVHLFDRLPIVSRSRGAHISAVVDLDDGTAIKGNLINVEPDPEKIEFGLPVDIVYDDALGRKDRDGNSYLAYFFQPSS